MKTHCMYLDEKTVKRAREYAKEHGMSMAAVIRMAVNEYFLRRGREA